MIADAWRLATGTLTAIPVPPPRRVDRATAGRAMLLAPAAVVPLGVLLATILYAGGRAHLPGLAVAGIALAALAAGTRALHWDGLSDVVDGLTASYDRERSLAVMKSGTSGPAGTMAIVLVALVQAASLSGISARTHGSMSGAALAGMAVCLSRAAPVLCCVRGVPAARRDGLGVTYTGTVPRWAAVTIWVVAAAVLGALGHGAGLTWWRGALAAMLAVGGVLLLLRHVTRRFGGVTGDVFGAAIELALAVLLLALA